MRLKVLAGAAAMLAAGTTYAAPEPAPADVVVISGTRNEHAGMDLSAAIEVIDGERIRDGQMRVNVSEALAAVPGLVVQNRQNYAQDLQISSRGFGARSAFGVRGVRLISDGIPATMPDGQGQAATFNLDMAERIEVLRGPYSALYGNHAGGTIQLFTRGAKGRPSIETSVMAGSDGARKVDVNAQGKAGAIGYVLDASRFEMEGYRDHSAATREQQFAKLTMAPWQDARLTLVANALHQGDTQDPLGVQWATFQRDPRAGETDPTDTTAVKRTYAERYNTRKSISHQQAGATYEQRFGADRLRISLYGGNREVIQYQAFSKAFQAPPSHSGGVVDFDRDFYGAGFSWLHVNALAGGALRTTAGFDYDRSSDNRQGYENFIGNQLGVKGALRRDETDVVSNADPYLQTEWQRGAWVASAGLRHSRVKIAVSDRFLSNGNDSGSFSFTRGTPVVGLLYKVSPALNVYASAARGFEAPTLNELFYSAKGAGFNFRLIPARSAHVELGAKALASDNTRIDAAIFQVHTSDELVVDVASGGRTSYRNAGRTLRQGAELSLSSGWDGGFSARLAMTALRAVYDEGFGNVREGSRLPGVPRATVYGELAWQELDGRYGAALEAVANSKVYVEDSNADIPAPGYASVNVRVNAAQQAGSWRLREFARLNNLFDHSYTGSVIVGDTNKRYYEAAPGRNWQLGVSAQYQF